MIENEFDPNTDDERPAYEQASRAKPVHVRSGSWWRSADGKRTMVVINIWRTTIKTIDSYDLSERGNHNVINVPADVFWEQVRAGNLVEIM